jgi:hypothetical protein
MPRSTGTFTSTRWRTPINATSVIPSRASPSRWKRWGWGFALVSDTTLKSINAGGCAAQQTISPGPLGALQPVLSTRSISRPTTCAPRLPVSSAKPLKTQPDSFRSTPQVKQVLEMALNEGLKLGHNYIGTEHILLGLIRTNDGVAAQILLDRKASAEKVRTEIIRMLNAPHAGPPDQAMLAALRDSLAMALRSVTTAKDIAISHDHFEWASRLKEIQRQLADMNFESVALCSGRLTDGSQA